MIAKLMTETPTHLRVLREHGAAGARRGGGEGARQDAGRPVHDRGRVLARARGAAPTQRSAAAPCPRRAAAAFRSRWRSARSSSSRRRRSARTRCARSRRCRRRSARRRSSPRPAACSSRRSRPTASSSPSSRATARGATCTYATVVQDVGGTTTRTILDSATAGYGLEWSPDRRNLMFAGTVRGRVGRRSSSRRSAASRAGSRAASRRSTPAATRCSSARVPPRLGVLRARRRARRRAARQHPHRRPGRPARGALRRAGHELDPHARHPAAARALADRRSLGKVADHVVNACTCGGIAATDAVWLARAGDGLEESVVRIAIDRSNGHFAARQDTMTHGVFTAFSLTGDGAKMVMDEGTFDHSVWAVPLADAIKGTLPDERRIAHASTQCRRHRLARRLDAARAAHRADRRQATARRATPSCRTREAPRRRCPRRGRADVRSWSDAQHVATSVLGPRGLRLSEVDVRSGAQRNVLELPDSLVRRLRRAAERLGVDPVEPRPHRRLRGRAPARVHAAGVVRAPSSSSRPIARDAPRALRRLRPRHRRLGRRRRAHARRRQVHDLGDALRRGRARDRVVGARGGVRRGDDAGLAGRCSGSTARAR